MRSTGSWKMLIVIILGFYFVFLLGKLIGSNIKDTVQPDAVTYKQFEQMVAEKKVSNVTINFEEETFEFENTSGQKYITDNPKGDFKKFLLENEIKINYISTEENKGTPFGAILLPIIVSALPLIFTILILSILVKTAVKIEKGNIFSEKISKNIPNVTFDDLQGCKELKQDVQFIINFLRNPEEYKRMGVRMPKGILLYGPPGTGKTLTAKAIAGTAGIPFFSASGSDFIELYVGVGAKRVRELYEKARKSAPCIVFIDEIDSIGGERGLTSNSERDQTINALLNELDGFNGTEGVITIAATNRLELLDSALTRPGRFDKHIAVPLPEREDRLEILKVHAKNKKLAEDIKLKDIAAMTVGFSGAALESLLNEAAFNAVNAKRQFITKEDIDAAFWKLLMKGHKKENKNNRDKEELEIVAWHEAGHALATKLLTNEEVPKVTIIASTSGAGGATFRTPKEKGLQSKDYLMKTIQIMYAGRAAEFLLLNDENKITTGAANDIKMASEAIKDYITTYGMSEEFGMLNFSVFKDFVDVDIVKEASKLAKDIYSKTVNILSKNKETLEKIAKALLDKETLSNEELDEILKTAA